MKNQPHERGRCTKCGGLNRIVVYRREGASGTKEPETWVCAVCAGERAETRETRERS